MSKTVVKLQPGRQKRIENGHPWIYRTEVAEIKGPVTAGGIVEVADFRGRFLGKGYINPASMIIVRLMTQQEEDVGSELIRRRLQAAYSFRQRLMEQGDSDSWRLVFGEADLLPGLIVDDFAGYLVIQTLTLGMDQWKDVIVQELAELVKPLGIYERNDMAVRELEGLPLIKGTIWGHCPQVVEIKENGIRINVDIVNGQKTGYFLDQRENRAALRGLARGARVLDMFCHTGSFALHAAHYGAREVEGLDISADAVTLAAQNARINGWEDRCLFRHGNAFDVLRAKDQAGERYDLIILDPPAFTKSRGAVEGALRGYKEINLRAMRLLPPGGLLVTNSCSYHLTEDLFLNMLQQAAKDVRRRIQLLEMRRQAKDHPTLMGYDESYYLKCAVLRVL